MTQIRDFARSSDPLLSSSSLSPPPPLIVGSLSRAELSLVWFGCETNNEQTKSRSRMRKENGSQRRHIYVRQSRSSVIIILRSSFAQQVYVFFLLCPATLLALKIKINKNKSLQTDRVIKKKEEEEDQRCHKDQIRF